MKKFKGIMGAILPFIYVLLVQFLSTFIVLFVYGVVEGVKLASQGITDPNEVAKIMENAVTSELTMLGIAISGLVTIFIFGLWYYKKFGKESEQKITQVFRGKTILWIVILGISLQIFISMILNVVSYALPNVFGQHLEHMTVFSKEFTFVSVILISIIAPISEELVFRGIILNKGKKVIPFIYANILQSILFGVFHGDLIQGIYAFFLGMILGVLYEKRNSIYGPIALHMIFNTMGILTQLVPDGSLEKYKLVVIALMILSIPGILFSLMKLNNEQVDIVENNEILNPGI